jgi:hypothetical protein
LFLPFSSKPVFLLKSYITYLMAVLRKRYIGFSRLTTH